GLPNPGLRLEVEVLRLALLEPELVVLGNVLQELRGVGEDVLLLFTLFLIGLRFPLCGRLLVLLDRGRGLALRLVSRLLGRRRFGLNRLLRERVLDGVERL